MTDVGFVGLGLMGRPMALNLTRAGFALTVLSRSATAYDELRAAGARIAGHPREVAERSEVVITMLPDSPEVEAVLCGPEGVFAAARPGHLLLEMSTIAPSVARAMAAEARSRGADLLDAPVSGGDVGAREGTLSIMVGGEEAAFRRAQPVLETLGRAITHVGPSGAGQALKACNQVMVAGIIESLCEGLALAERSGIPAEVLLDVTGAGLAATRVGEVRHNNLVRREYVPGFRTRLHRKDLAIALAEASSHGLELPGTVLAKRLMDELVERGLGDLDHTAMLGLLAGVAVAPGAEPST